MFLDPKSVNYLNRFLGPSFTWDAFNIIWRPNYVIPSPLFTLPSCTWKGPQKKQRSQRQEERQMWTSQKHCLNILSPAQHLKVLYYELGEEKQLCYYCRI